MERGKEFVRACLPMHLLHLSHRQSLTILTCRDTRTHTFNAHIHLTTHHRLVVERLWRHMVYNLSLFPHMPFREPVLHVPYCLSAEVCNYVYTCIIQHIYRHIYTVNIHIGDSEPGLPDRVQVLFLGIIA